MLEARSVTSFFLEAMVSKLYVPVRPWFAILKRSRKSFSELF